MNEAEVHSRVLDICRQVLGAADLEIRDEDGAKQIPNYDSLAHIGILVRCQQEFGISLGALEAGQIANFGELKALVRRKLAGKG